MCITVNKLPAPPDPDHNVYIDTCVDSIYQQWDFIPENGVMYAGACLRMSAGNIRNRAGYCLNIYEDGTWDLSQGNVYRHSPDALLRGKLPSNPSTSWYTLQINATGSAISISLNNTSWRAQTLVVENTEHKSGMVTLGSGWGTAVFDDFSVT